MPSSLDIFLAIEVVVAVVVVLDELSAALVGEPLLGTWGSFVPAPCNPAKMVVIKNAKNILFISDYRSNFVDFAL